MSALTPSDWFDAEGWLKREVTREDAESAAHMGRCDEDVEALFDRLDFRSPIPQSRRYLKSLGVDGVDEMSDHDVQVWILWEICWHVVDDEPWNDFNIQEV